MFITLNPKASVSSVAHPNDVKLEKLKQDIIKKFRTNIARYCDEESTIIDAYSCIKDLQKSATKDLQKFSAVYGKSRYNPMQILVDLCSETLVIDKEKETDPLFKKILIDKKDDRSKRIKRLEQDARQIVLDIYNKDEDPQVMGKALREVGSELGDCTALLLLDFDKNRTTGEAQRIWNKISSECDKVCDQLIASKHEFNNLTLIGDQAFKEAMLRDDEINRAVKIMDDIEKEFNNPDCGYNLSEKILDSIKADKKAFDTIEAELKNVSGNERNKKLEQMHETIETITSKIAQSTVHSESASKLIEAKLQECDWHIKFAKEHDKKKKSLLKELEVRKEENTKVAEGIFGIPRMDWTYAHCALIRPKISPKMKKMLATAHLEDTAKS